MDFRAILKVRRDNGVHSTQQIKDLVKGATDGTLPDYQLSAWLMAAVLNPLSKQETVDLTLAMAHSGQRLDLTGLNKPWVDKHSTGGVGDKTTLVLLPLLASCGITMVKMSGRGLGITGGTIDKLEAIPGFKTDLTPAEMIAQAKRIGLALTGQTPELAPADKTFYAMRDVTETVASIPLIVSSILSKKIAGGAETVSLDVKCGSGSFMPNLAAAEELANWLYEVGTQAGLNVQCAITDMDQPLGRTAGNALEVLEAYEVLEGAKGRFYELCINLAADTLVVCKQSASLDEGKQKAREALESGRALESAKLWIESQGGAFGRNQLVTSPVAEMVTSPIDGYVHQVSASAVGHAVLTLKGGRTIKGEELDLSAGIETLVEVGSEVQKGQVVQLIRTKDKNRANLAREILEAGLSVKEEAIAARNVVLQMVPEM